MQITTVSNNNKINCEPCFCLWVSWLFRIRLNWYAPLGTTVPQIFDMIYTANNHWLMCSVGGCKLQCFLVRPMPCHFTCLCWNVTDIPSAHVLDDWCWWVNGNWCSFRPLSLCLWISYCHTVNMYSVLVGTDSLMSRMSSRQLFQNEMIRWF